MRRVISLLFLNLLPLSVAFAATLEDAVITIGRIINLIIPIVFALLLVYFFWGLVKYVMSAGDEEKKKEGRSAMIYGIIGMFVAAAVWGIVNMIAQTFGVGTGGTQQVPKITP